MVEPMTVAQRVALPLLLALSGCASDPAVYRMERARTTFIWADGGTVTRAWKARGAGPDDYGFPVKGEVGGFASLKSDGWCEVWLAWMATVKEVLHEMAHCEKWARMKVAETF
jgi:hypothetical protein